MKIKTDFLVIGGGISGLSFAIYLAQLLKDSNILIITKEKLIDSNTYHAQGGIACVWDKKDNFEKQKREDYNGKFVSYNRE